MNTAEQKDGPEEKPEEGEAVAPEKPVSEEDRFAALEADLAEAKDRAMRALAEAENTRRRAVKDREDAGKFAVSGFARDLLDFADNFARALEAIPEDLKGSDARLDNVMSGLDAMQRDLLGAFEKHGIKKIQPLDEVFDPNFHEVMFEAPVPGKAAGIIIQVVEPGYMLNGRLLRPARVGIAKTEEGGAPSPSGTPGGRIDQEV